MRIGILAVSERKSEKLRHLARALTEEFARLGHAADLVESGDSRLGYAEFAAVVSEPSGVGGKIGSAVSVQLSRCMGLQGKRSMALLVPSGLMPGKALSALMRDMEREGMVVTSGELISTESEAIRAARGASLIRG